MRFVATLFPYVAVKSLFRKIERKDPTVTHQLADQAAEEPHDLA